jgi:hypothetical protein
MTLFFVGTYCIDNMFVPQSVPLGCQRSRPVLVSTCSQSRVLLRAELSSDDEDFASAPPAIRRLLTKHKQSARTLFGRAQSGADEHANLWWLSGEDYVNPDGIMELAERTSDDAAPGTAEAFWTAFLNSGLADAEDVPGEAKKPTEL